MHLFLYKAARHTTPNTYYSQRRLVQGTYRNDFDLDLIKGGIKGRYTIKPHGSNAFQARLKDFGLEEEFYGHIIEVPDVRNAIWFKLNYDNIGKPGTTYVGSWKNLDVNELIQYDIPYKDLIAHKAHIDKEYQQVNYHVSMLSSFLANRNNLSNLMDEPKIQGQIYLEKLRLALATLRDQSREAGDDLIAIRDKIKTYMKTREM